MPAGTIKKKTDKGFGFIAIEGEQDMFFHMSSCKIPFNSLQEGQAVTFEIGTNPRDGRARAENVTPVS